MLLTQLSLKKRELNFLKKKKIETTDDLLHILPRSYHDYRTIRPIEACVGMHAAVTGILYKIKEGDTKNGRKYINMALRQDNGTWISVMLFSVYNTNGFIYHWKSYMRKQIVVCGAVSQSEYGYSITGDDILDPEAFEPHIHCVYPKYSGMSEDRLKALINGAFPYVTEPMDEPLYRSMVKSGDYPTYYDALHMLHYPESKEDIVEGKKRLRMNDLLYFSLELEKQNAPVKEQAIRFTKYSYVNQVANMLPYELTRDQMQAVNHIIRNARDGVPNRVLIQGDVGSGKTVVAIMAIMTAVENGCQALLMAPREVLAKQHYDEICTYAKALEIPCVFLHSGMKAKEKKAMLKGIASGEIKIIVGTQSCVSEHVRYQNLGLSVIDEEHLFGVKQKDALQEKSLKGSHLISMSATPIPRSIANVLYGGATEILSIKTKPKGRKEIITRAVNKREQIFLAMREEIAKGHQCYVVCPAIEENKDTDLISLEEMEKEYRAYFESFDITVGTVNGKMKDEDVAQNIEAFASNRMQVLISTTVIEVGVNVPNATVMVIEQAERFGLASLHQLRGRVGRGQEQSYCYLRTEALEEPRIEVMCRTTDGFQIAEADLKNRGSGNLIGLEQSGKEKLLERALQYPELFEEMRTLAKECMEKGYGEPLMRLYTEGEESSCV